MCGPIVLSAISVPIWLDEYHNTSALHSTPVYAILYNFQYHVLSKNQCEPSYCKVEFYMISGISDYNVFFINHFFIIHHLLFHILLNFCYCLRHRISSFLCYKIHFFYSFRTLTIFYHFPKIRYDYFRTWNSFRKNLRSIINTGISHRVQFSIWLRTWGQEWCILAEVQRCGLLAGDTTKHTDNVIFRDWNHDVVNFSCYRSVSYQFWI